MNPLTQIKHPTMIESQIKVFARNLVFRAGYSIHRSDHLTTLADKFGSDKGNSSYGHCYARIYDRFFSKFRNSDIVFVEIGLLRADVDKRRNKNAAEGKTFARAKDAPSLRMWRRYFRAAQLFGFDIDDFSEVRIDRCEIIRGDMSSPEDLSRLASTIGRSIDILIDDGSHASHHQQIAFGTLFDRITSGGMYIIEDLHWQDPTLERPDAPKTRDIFRRFLSQGNIVSPYISPSQQDYLQKNIRSMFLFDSMTTSVEDPTDALAVLIKK
jgi:hypothetical protein